MSPSRPRRFRSFLPFMLAFSLLFTGVFFVFGDNFLHGGRPAVSPPRYIDPEVGAVGAWSRWSLGGFA